MKLKRLKLASQCIGHFAPVSVEDTDDCSESDVAEEPDNEWHFLGSADSPPEERSVKAGVQLICEALIDHHILLSLGYDDAVL